MFFLLALLSVFGYALQTALLAHHARKIDGLSLAFYRNISFAVTLLPLLIGTSVEDSLSVLRQWPLLLLSAAAGAMHLGLVFTGFLSLPVGIATSINRATVTALLMVIGWVFFQEELTPLTVLLIAVAFGGTICLALQRNRFPHLQGKAMKGVLFSVSSAFPFAVTSTVLAVLSRESSALAASYWWEVTIALGAGMLLLGRKLTGGRVLEKIDFRAFSRIALCASPTLIGTGSLALALRMGPVGVASGIASMALPIMAVLSWRLYGERLTRVQWIAIGVVTLVIGLLKIV